jgi:acyl carrier protein
VQDLDSDPDGPLRAVFHTAGVLADGLIDGLTRERCARVLAAKARGARHLHELTRARDLDAFVLFSSFAGTFGSAGQGAYAAANAYLDALAESRRAEGLPATSIAWGAWAGGGMLDKKVAGQLHRRGLREMAPSDAIAALAWTLDESRTHAVVADVDWPRFAGLSAIVRPSPLLSELPDARIAESGVDAAVAADGPHAFAQKLQGLSTTEQTVMLVETICAQAAVVLGHAATDVVAARRSFKELGFDSLSAVELRNRLSRVTGITLPTTLLFDYPNAAALAQHLRAEMLASDNGGIESVLAEIDRLSRLLAGTVSEDAGRYRISDRLRSLMTEWSGDAGTTDGAGAVTLDSGSDEEVFAYIGKEFGIAWPAQGVTSDEQ